MGDSAKLILTRVFVGRPVALEAHCTKGLLRASVNSDASKSINERRCTTMFGKRKHEKPLSHSQHGDVAVC